MEYITVEKIIEFYSHANEHYPISDLLVYKYAQKKGGYVELADEFKGIVPIRDEDKKFFDSDVIEQTKYTPLKYFFMPQSGKGIPSQKWHFLISYYMYKEITGNKDIKKIEESKPDDWYFTDDKRTEYKCPELCLWMVEAAMEGNIITLEDVHELFYQAVEFKQNKQTTKWEEYSWWVKNRKNYWNKIQTVIKGSF